MLTDRPTASAMAARIFETANLAPSCSAVSFASVLLEEKSAQVFLCAVKMRDSNIISFLRCRASFSDCHIISGKRELAEILFRCKVQDLAFFVLFRWMNNFEKLKAFYCFDH